MINSFRDLFVWQKSMFLVTEVYKVTSSFPDSETYGLKRQMRRSAVSVPSNIAEGYGRKSTGDYNRFLQVSVGSLYELQTQIELSLLLGFLEKISHAELMSSTIELDRMLFSLIRKL